MSKDQSRPPSMAIAPCSTSGFSWGRAGLIGRTGFVGGNLARSVRFAKTYSSADIDSIAGEGFDVLVCAGAPAIMWAANADPTVDRANLLGLAAAVQSARTEKLILISTIAVFDDPAGGYTEHNASYETAKAYGVNRRELELRLAEHPDAHIVRLPALFGRGLKKNFIFDVRHPVPSYVKPELSAALKKKMSDAEKRLVDTYYTPDLKLGMMKLDRDAARSEGQEPALERAFERAGFLARSFTNSESEFQYYYLDRLKNDLETCMAGSIRTLNVCSAPLRAADVHEALTGKAYDNTGPRVTKEDVRTVHAGAYGRPGPYLYDRADVIADLRAFTSAAA